MMLAMPALEARLGDIAAAVGLVGLASLFGIGAYLIFRSEAQVSWPLPAIDALAMLAVAPTTLVASSLAVADPRVGGGWGSVLAAAVAITCALVITLLFAALTTSMAEAAPESAALAFLPAPLIVAALVLGAGRFGADQAALGISAALMIAALATLADGMIDARLRPLNPVVWFALFVGGVAIIARGGGATPVASASNAIALLVTVAGGMLLLAAPALAAWVDRQRRRRIRPETG